MDLSIMSHIDTNLLPSRAVPKYSGLVLAAGQNIFSIRGKGDIFYRTGMALQSANFLSAFNIPKLRSMVIIPRKDILAIGRECHTCHLAVLGMASQDVKFFTCRCLPNAGSRVETSCKYVLAIR